MGTVDAATKNLQQRYISSRFSSVDEWPPYQPKHYTTLAFIHNKGKFTDAVRFSVAQELVVAGKIHVAQPCRLKDLNISMTKNISDIFLPLKAPDESLMVLRVLIEGAPGIGKTVLAKEIAYRWAKNELLTSKKLLLLVFLRECSQTQLKSIKELVKHVFINDEMVPQLINYLFKTEGEGAVIIFDGFDELSEENRKDSIIIDIINRRILTKVCLVITSRPTVSSILHGTVDRRVEIVGFTEEDRLDYIQTTLGENYEQVKALQHYLQSNPTINALCYVPLNMTILLCLAEDGIDTLPKTQTEMYKKFIEMTIVRFVKKHENRTLLIKIGELPHPHNKLFVELAKVAYDALRIDKIVFTLSEIKESCPNLTIASNNWNGLGLLKAVQYFSVELGNDQVTFHFLHFSIQEYMAAWYISKLSDNKQIKLLKKSFWEHHYYNIWIMYIGITSGSSFALRHFLSGNRFQLYSKLFKNSKVSNKYLNNKMTCLHLFQCLVEADKEDIIVSVKQFFQSNQIDLSNQTLLPSDLNTLGFFLIRSLNKEWDELDLSNCNIGSEGCNILCDRFLGKDVRSIVTIKMVNFSYNQLNLSSFIRLFGLFNSWHTSEIIITDEAILDNGTDDKAIEEMILQSSTLALVLIGLYFFSKNLQLSKVLHVLSNTTNIRIIYLLNCCWKFDSKTSELLEKQKLNKVRIIGPSLDELFIKAMALLLLHNNDYVNMLVYDPTMSNEIADDISSVIASSSKDISGVMLIVSSSKVQGIVNTCTMTNELSAVELFNLNRYVRYFNTEVCSWSENFEGKNFNKESIVVTFINMLYIIKTNWQLHIAVIENDVLIAHKAKFDNIRKHYNNNISIVYFSSCDVNQLDYDIVSTSCSVLHSLNSPGCVELLYNKLLHKQSIPTKLFIYGDIEDSLMNSLIKLILHHHRNSSAVLVANDIIVGHNPNIQQIALAFQLQPSTTKWVLCGPVNAIVFYQVDDALGTLHTHWIELDFTCCNISDVECEIIHRNLKFMKHSSTVKKLNIPFNKLTVSGIYDLVRVIVIWGVQELNIKGTNDVLYDCLINNLTNGSKNISEYFLSITYYNKLICFVCNASWNKIVTKMSSQFTEFYIANCDLALLNSKEIDLLNSLSRQYIVYFSSCDVNKHNYDIVKSCSVIHSLNSPGYVKNKLLYKQSVPNELFIYGDIMDSLMNSLIKLISHHHHNISAVLVGNDVIVGHNPNIQQIALAFQLQPSTTKWVLCGPVNAIVFYQVVEALVTLHTQWIELDFTCCNISDVECEIMHRILTMKHSSTTVKKLNIPFNKLTVSGIYDLVRVIVIWGVQELNINGTNDVLYDCLINNLINGSKNINEYFLSITYCNNLICFVCNASWNKIVTKRSSQFTEFYIINCDLALLNSKEIDLLNSLSRQCIVYFSSCDVNKYNYDIVVL